VLQFLGLCQPKSKPTDSTTILLCDPDLFCRSNDYSLIPAILRSAGLAAGLELDVVPVFSLK